MSRFFCARFRSGPGIVRVIRTKNGTACPRHFPTQRVRRELRQPTCKTSGRDRSNTPDPVCVRPSGWGREPRLPGGGNRRKRYAMSWRGGFANLRARPPGATGAGASGWGGNVREALRTNSARVVKHMETESSAFVRWNRIYGGQIGALMRVTKRCMEARNNDKMPVISNISACQGL